MARWAKAAMCMSGTRVPLMAQTARRPRFARSAVASGAVPSSTCAPRSGTAAARRSTPASSVFVSRVSLNPRLTRFCCSEQERCIFGSAGRVPFDLGLFALFLFEPGRRAAVPATGTREAAEIFLSICRVPRGTTESSTMPWSKHAAGRHSRRTFDRKIALAAGDISV